MPFRAAGARLFARNQVCTPGLSVVLIMAEPSEAFPHADGRVLEADFIAVDFTAADFMAAVGDTGDPLQLPEVF